MDCSEIEAVAHNNPDEIPLDEEEEEEPTGQSSVRNDDDEAGDFFIDTRGSASQWTAPAYQENKPSSPLNQTETPPVKKFKRRNQEIYSTHENNDDNNGDSQ